MKKRWWFGILLVYVGMLLLGTLVVHGRSLLEWVQLLVPPGPLQKLLMYPLQHHHPVTFAKLLNLADRLINILLFIPLGIGIFLAFDRVFPYSVRITLLIALCAGLLLSLGIETLQSLVPNRIPSAADVISNTAGSVLGCYVLCYRKLVRKREKSVQV